MTDTDTTTDDRTAPEPDPLGELTDDTRTSMQDHEPTRDDSTATPDSRGLTGPQDESYDPITLYDHFRHRAVGDETAVLLCSFADGYQAIAIDVDRDGKILDIEEIGSLAGDDHQKAEGIAEYWVQQNPKGILGGDGTEEESGGFGGRIGRMFGFGGDGA